MFSLSLVLPAAKKPVKKSRRESEDQVPDSTNKTSLDAVAIRGHAQKALRQVLMARYASLLLTTCTVHVMFYCEKLVGEIKRNIQYELM